MDFVRPLHALFVAALLSAPVGCGTDTNAKQTDTSTSPEDAQAQVDATPPADASPPPQMVTSVTQYGITWTFDATYGVGQFATGDYWVVGPVTITDVTPAPTGARNGSMLNPVGAQAYDDRGGRYDGSKNLAFPLLVSPNNSLVSSISHPDQSACTQGGSPGWMTYNGACQRGPIATQAVLTVVASPQGPHVLRPPYAGTDKPMHTTASVQWDLLSALPPPTGTPDGTTMLRHLERPWIDHLDSWTMQHGCATLNMYCYGREIGSVISQVATYVLLDTPDQRAVATRLLQLGIDNYGVLQAGGGWGADGGHFNGRKWPIMFAGGLLGDATMASPGTDIGNEDAMTYEAGDGTPRWGRACNSCCLGNGCSYGGKCSNGAKDCRDPAGAVDGCGSYRNCCTSRYWVGEALAARILGLDDDWGHPAFFDYVDRWMTGNVSGADGASSDYIDELWNTYR